MMKSAVALLLFAPLSAFASTFVYTVAVDTSSIAFTGGSIDFQFNPGNTSDLATAAISNFQIGGPGLLTGPPQFFGDASGTLPSSLTVANTDFDNEALQPIDFGTSLSFRVTIEELFTGTAIDGSVFNFGLFQADGITPLLTADPSGFAASVNLDNLAGSAGSTTTALAVVTAVPEPATSFLFGAALVGWIAVRKRRSGYTR